jgi:hypothetical protein
MYSRTPPCGVFMLYILFGFLQGYFSLPQGYPYQWGGYVYYPAPYIPPYPLMHSYPESCCCFDYGIETVFSEISNQGISGDGNPTPEIVAQMTSTAGLPTTASTTIGQLTEGLSAEKNPGNPEEESPRFSQQTTIQPTTELIIEPKTVTIYEISAELSTTASESTNQSKAELSAQSITETNTEPIVESSKITPEGTESTTESTESATVSACKFTTVSACKFTTKLTKPKQQSNTESTIKLTESATESSKLVTETTDESTIKMTEYTQALTIESTTTESVSSTETSQRVPETTEGSTTESSGHAARSTVKSTKESTAQTTIEFEIETPTATTLLTIDSMPNEENQYNVGEGMTAPSASTEGIMILNRVTGKDYFLGRTTEASAESTGDNYKRLNTASNTELTTESNKVSSSGFATRISSDDIYDGISHTEEYDFFPYLDPA